MHEPAVLPRECYLIRLLHAVAGQGYASAADVLYATFVHRLRRHHHTTKTTSRNSSDCCAVSCI